MTHTLATTARIAIPTAARPAVRAFIKSQNGFAVFCSLRGRTTGEALNADLLDYAEAHGLLDAVQSIIASIMSQPAPPVVAAPPAPTVIAPPAPPAPSISDAALDQVAADLADALDMDLAVSEAFDAAAILSPIEQLLSPMLRKELERALGPVISAANKPAPAPVVAAVPLPVAPAGKPAYPVRKGTVAFGSLFGVKAHGKARQGYLSCPVTLWESHGQAPAPDAFYVLDPEQMAQLATAAEHETNVWFFGPAGSGKTSLPMQFAAVTGRPITRLVFTRQTEVGELVGSHVFRDGATVWEDGALVSAMRVPGMVILLDEPTLAPAGVQAIIQACTDEHRAYTIQSTGEVVRIAPGVVFCIADNTNGTGDDTGRYHGTNQSNEALLNRFKRMVRVDYMPRAREVQALINHTCVPQAAAEHVVDFFIKARKLPEMEGAAFSLRQMTGFVNAVKDGFSSKSAFEVTVLNRLAGTERAAVEALATLDWNNAFEKLLDGAPSQTATNVPSDSAGARAFDDDVSGQFSR